MSRGRPNSTSLRHMRTKSVGHFDWLDRLFNERLEIDDGRMVVSSQPGLGFTMSDQAKAWTVATAEARK